MSAIAICELPYDPKPLRIARAVKELTLRQAAKEIGMHFITLQKIESGTKTTRDTLELICKFYELPIDSVLPAA